MRDDSALVVARREEHVAIDECGKMYCYLSLLPEDSSARRVAPIRMKESYATRRFHLAEVISEVFWTLSPENGPPLP